MGKTQRYFQSERKINENFNKTEKLQQVKKENESKWKTKNEVKLRHINTKNLKVKKYILNKFARGDSVQSNGLKTKYHQKLWQERDKQIELAIRHSARTTVLLNEQEGYIDTEGDSGCISQSEILANVDITSASKHFNLNLDQFGPYRLNYSENGRHLLLGGRKGHVASFDWVTKHLSCEMNVMEEITDISWLYNESMFAVAQKSYVHIYDNKGMQLHCIKRMNATNFLEFLPYHLLLAAGNDEGYLSWLDISIGEIVSQYNSKLGHISNMCQDKSSGIIYTGDMKGVVSLWCPSARDPLVQVSCHNTPIAALTVNPNNRTILTSDINRTVKVWDARKLGEPVSSRKLWSSTTEMNVSQKGFIALAIGNICEIHKNNVDDHPCLRYPLQGNIRGLQFCPFEDILGISTNNEFASIIVPGSAEANFDAFESNPYQSKSQRKENEVRRLLDKIPMEMISLNPDKILEVDTSSFKEKLAEKKKVTFLKPQKVDFTPRQKKKSKNSSKIKRKQIVRETAIRDFKKNIEPLKKQIQREPKSGDSKSITKSTKKNQSVLDRFKNKSRLQ